MQEKKYGLTFKKVCVEITPAEQETFMMYAMKNRKKMSEILREFILGLIKGNKK